MAKRHRQRRASERGREASSRDSQGALARSAAFRWPLAVGLCAVVVYLNAPGNEFVLDDLRQIRDNLRIRSLANIPGLFASSYWDLEGAQALYRPLVLATYAVNYAAHGLSPWGYTAVNIALHAAVSILLFAVVRAIGGSLLAAGVAGIAFAVHPVHTEAVTGISGRPELLAAVFVLLAVYFHRLAGSARHGAPGYRAAALASCACALLSKESAITLVLVLPVTDALVPSIRSDGRPATPRTRILSDYVPILAVALAYLAVRWTVLGGIVIPEQVIAPLDNPLVPVTTMPLGERMGATTGQAIMTAFAVIAEYARLLAWPLRLSPDYSYNHVPLVTSALEARFLTGVALMAVWGGAVGVLWRRNSVATFGLVLLGLTYSIVSNFVVLIGTICAERLIYLPSAGALIALAAGAEWLAGRVPERRRLAYTVIVVVLMAAAARTWTRNRDWQNEFTLWSAAIEAAPGSARVQSEYGRILLARAEREVESGRAAEAERLYAAAQTHFETAVKIFPSYSLPLDGLAMVHSLHDRYDQALVFYERALEAWPGNYASLTNWGSLLWEQCKRTAGRALALRQDGRIAEADALSQEADAGCRQAHSKIDRAIAMMPTYAHAHLVRAQIVETYLGDPAGAAAEYEEVLRLMPNHPERPLIEREIARLRSVHRQSTR
jgi:tetratricopeptide (TPR) repeat protein